MSINRENNIIRLKNWAAVHIKELDSNNPLFKRYLDLYLKTDEYQYNGQTYPLFVFSTGHTGSLWTAFLFQVLNPDFMGCFHDHETVHAWSEFKFTSFDEKSWNYCLQQLIEVRKNEPKEILNKLSPNLLPHMETELARYPVVVYCLTGIIDLYYEIMKSAAGIYPASKTICLARNGIQVVNSLYHIFLKTMPDYYKCPASLGGNKIRSLKNEFFALLFEDPLLNKSKPTYKEAGRAYPGYDLFITCCIIWSLIYETFTMDFSKKERACFLITRLEDVVSGKKHIMQLYRFLLGEIQNQDFFDCAVELAQSMDINKKINDKQLDSIWQKQWDDSQREIFRNICGKMMGFFNYNIPDNN